MVTRRVALLVAVFGVLSSIPQSAVAQTATGLEPGIVAVGFGQATAPAETAKLQFLLGSSTMFGGGMVYVEEEPVTGEATPGPGAMPPGAMGGQASVTEEQLAPIVSALVAAGATEADITVTVPVISDSFGPGGPNMGEILVQVDRPQGELLQTLVDSVFDSASGVGLVVLTAGAMYEPADCAALVQQAREEAIADARVRAEGLAKGLAVSLGDLVQASETPYFGIPGGTSCAPEGMDSSYGPYGPGTYPSFDPRQTDASTSIQVVLTFAIGAAT
jgi:hypothetical protein